MFGIYRNTETKWRRWIRAWFEILDQLFGILTFDSYYMDLTGWWAFDEDTLFGKSAPSSFLRRISFCIVSSIEIVEEIFVILTLGYLIPSWVSVFCLFIDKHFTKE